ncbi:MAG: hypothetical protein ACJ77K_09835 [Bacteroidia bacterium]
MRKLILYLLLFSISGGLFSQAPGYMGKRFVVTHSCHYFPAFGNASLFRRSGWMNVTEAIGADIAMHNNMNICIAAQYIGTGVDYVNGYSTSFYDIKVADIQHAPAPLNVIQFSLGLKKFRKRMMAPIGFYMKWELLYMKCFLDYDPGAFEVRGVGRHGYSPVSETGRIQGSGIGGAYSVGFQRILWHKLVVDYGGRFELSGTMSGYYEHESDTYMMRNATSRLRNHQILSLKLGIGYLAF